MRHISLGLFVIVLAALAGAVFILPMRYGGMVPLPVVLGACIAVGLGGAAVVFQQRCRPITAVCCATICAGLFYPIFALGVAPQLQALWLSPRAATAAAKSRHPGDPPVVLAGYVEPSLVFLMGNDTRIETGESAAKLSAEEGGLVWVDDREKAMFLAALPRLGASAFAVDRLDGLDYSKGRKEQLTLYRVSQARQIVIPPED
jgi:hypothetical protein